MFWTKCVDELAHKMLKAVVKFYNHKKCLGLWPATSFPKVTNPNTNITEDLFCTDKFGNESCAFDLGAPLTHDGKLLGILTRGGCSQRPEIYTNLVKFKAWLDKNSK